MWQIMQQEEHPAC